VSQFLHGVETIEYIDGPIQVTEVASGIIGLVGAAPIMAVASANQTINKAVICRTDKDDALYFGPSMTGFSIPDALALIRANGIGTALVINVFDPAIHNTAVASESVTLGANGCATLAHPGVIPATAVLKVGATALAVGTDYTLDSATSTITRVASSTALLAGATITAAYSYGDPTKIQASDIIGGVNVAGARIGMQAFQDCHANYGFSPKILIAPGYSSLATVTSALDSLAAKLRAFAYADAPAGTTVTQAITGRGPNGTINFNMATKRLGLCAPYVQTSVGLQPSSTLWAAATAAKDQSKGYWWSPSNTSIKGVLALERPLTARINDPNSEVNALNAAGILTVFNDFGSGFLTWGNRSSAFPGSADPDTFISVRRTFDMIEESIEMSSIRHQDAPITTGLIDTIVEEGNSFIRTLIGRGALVDGKAFYDASRNSVSELAAGHLVISYKAMAPPPAERITYESHIDIRLLSILNGGN
jgi:phage tail sheath protein FI